ncbi:hypothetical protein DFJ58DRAFT_730931 [Suillus subalutaceus]|uniref:uncharacterized protein n=1 Tax=Suillus subalutaceus TaxID=48586 RepID=UPI001B865582|nr:uncharacterized protein DFJ58DRAFT_730931 [Suillus subalutaceus]KAG1845081.1 hypothetical protein DFJ58DRAFT_730931 [Suillus subalutaceus]
MYGSQGSQRRPSGVPVYPNQHGVSEDHQSQMMGHNPYQFSHNQPCLSPLTVPNSSLPQHNDFFSGPVPDHAMPGGDALNPSHSNEHMGRLSGNNSNIPDIPFAPARTPFSSSSEPWSHSHSLAPSSGHDHDYNHFQRPQLNVGMHPYQCSSHFQDQPGDMQRYAGS